MRLLGVTIPDEKKIKISLTYIYGVGESSAKKILEEVKVDPEKRTKEISTEEANKIKNAITDKYKIEGELRQKVKHDISRLKEISSYRGGRHMRNLPVRGQRTKTNSRTAHGNTRKTTGSGRRKSELK